MSNLPAYGDIKKTNLFVAPFVVGTTPTQLVSQTVLLGKVQLALLVSVLAPDTSPTITLTDGQSTPVAALCVKYPSLGAPLLFDFEGRVMLNGIAIQCDAPNAVTCYAEFAIPPAE